MSRLIIKNLPSYVTPDRLRAHFEQEAGPGGILTDVKVPRKQDGTSRRFGFVGYKTNQEALSAKNWFDRTFVDSTRISVNLVEGAKDAPTPRPNKRPRTEPSSTIPRQSGSSQAATEKPESKSTSQLDEFMEIMHPRSKKGPSWANDTETSQPNVQPPASETSISPNHDPSLGEGLSDLEWMKRHMSTNPDRQEKVFEQSDHEDGGEPTNTPTESAPSSDPVRDTILQTSRLFVRNLAFSCTDSDLLELFKPFGDINQAIEGLAYVTFSKPSDALAAYEALDRKSFQGRLLHILAAVDRKGNLQVETAEGRKKTVKDERGAKRKAMAGKEFNWSMLYMNSDAVASSIADRMNIPKAAILNPESGDNAAVKLALAETHIIQETKAYLEAQGVSLSSFSSRQRSDTTILVKNIPYGTTAEQIREMFDTHGALNRVLVPPAGTMAVVDFERPDEAAKAFRAVAYRRLGNSVVYLEKGPLDMFTDGPTPTKVDTAGSVSELTHHAVKIREQQLGEDLAGDEPSVNKGTTLFLKNISFSTTQEKLTNVFRGLPSFSFARIQTKPDPKRPDARLSMGYGFVGFKDVDGATKAMKSMQGFHLDGHALHVQFAGRGADEQEEKSKGVSKSRTTKMIVKNVPFEATKKDIRELFSSHGQLKSVRVPKKFDSRTRGFAFLDFVTRHEAENAYAALRHTHLLGRHLVLEWAEEAEQDLDALRKKAGVGFGDGKYVPGKKRKIDLGKNGEEDAEDMDV
ncbi:hypothetical protein BD779DRAFT_1581736 [Infundibulicybe gibba]|nr:hypothetical protein BD779DRAFT_1581736 [Infundibulicybe gibba]